MTPIFLRRIRLNKEEIICQNCESEFYVESEEDIIFCVTCGEELKDDEEDYEIEEDWD